MKRILLIIIAIVVLINIDGCAPSRTTEDMRVISADRLIKKLEANRRKIKTLRGVGSLSIYSTDVNAKSSFEVLIKKPDSLKVSFYGPFNIDLAQVVISDKNFQFYDMINNTLYQGNIRDGIMKQLLKIDLPLDEIIDALAGSVNLTDKLRIEPDVYEAMGELYKLTYKDSTLSLEKNYIVRAKDLAITQYVVNKFNGRTELEGKYGGFKLFDEVPFPFEISLEDNKNKQRLKIDYKRVEVNETLNDFRLQIPNDAKVIQW